MKIPKQQSGFVSLFTCIMISMLLLIVTVSLITVESLQLRKAVDAEQTLRAYYTAEAGVEDAVSKVLSEVIKPGVGDKVCNRNDTYDTAGAAGWTCQQITFSGSPTGKTDKADFAKTIDAGGGGSFNSVIIEWGQSTNPGGYDMPGAFTATGFPSAPGYSAGGFSVPPIELALIEYPNSPVASNDVCNTTGAPASCKLKLENLLIAPNGGTGSYVADYSSPTFTTNGPFRANCGAMNRSLPAAIGGGITNYNCYALISHLTGNNYMFRLQSKYTGTPYKMVFRTGVDGSGTNASVPDGTATIDVTANAGQTYRRVISKLPLNSSASGGLNYVIYSDTNVCKNFDVVNNDAQPGCPY